MAQPSQVAYFHNDHDHPVPSGQVLQAIVYEPCSCTEDTTQLVKKLSQVHVNHRIIWAMLILE